MSKTRFFQILFSLAVIAALALAIAPAPVYALSATGTHGATIGSVTTQAGSQASSGVLVCRRVVVRHNGHVIKVLRCHRVTKSD
jgi:uncharacterized membrane protein YdjX (TVP38/TMEM64 family)